MGRPSKDRLSFLNAHHLFASTEKRTLDRAKIMPVIAAAQFLNASPGQIEELLISQDG
jgi:hypothetical protein